MFSKFILAFVILLVNYELSQCVKSCGDWTPAKDSKCLKVLDKKATEEDALNDCTQLDSSSTLITINSKEEQEFLNNLLQKYNNVSDNVWIGMKWESDSSGSNGKFKWFDDSSLDYINWGEDAIKDGSLACVLMSLTSSSLGKWTDQNCKKLGLVVCQRKETDIDSNDLKTVVDNLVNVVKKQQNEINSLKAGSVPIGFIYTQLPQQSAPRVLWPNTHWTEVTNLYSGLFFRAEGKGSLPFGQTQQANYSRISDIEVRSSEFNGWRDDTQHGPLRFALNESTWTNIKPGGLLYWLKFYQTAAEPRPQNTAVKIWKRLS